jgi:hypothetical protein
MSTQYNPLDTRTWPFFPITLPLLQGEGPVSAAECDSITWEVWDRTLTSYGSFDNLPDAINEALRLTQEQLDEK